MKALQFDFVRARPRYAPLSWLLLLLGLGGAGMAVAEYLSAQAQWQQARETLAAQTTPVARAPRVPSGASATPVSGRSSERATQRAMASLDTPWGPLLRGMETLEPQGVALLAIEASATPGTAGGTNSLRLIGEAREVGDAVAYVESLRGLPTVRGAELSHHERRLVDGAELLRFSINVDWSGAAP